MIDEFRLREEIFENFLRIASQKHKRLWVKIELDSGKKANLWIREGKILHASVGELSGFEAFKFIIGSKYIKILGFKRFKDEDIPLSIDVYLDEALNEARKYVGSGDKIKGKGESKMINNLNNIIKKLKTDIPSCLGVGVFHITEGLMLSAATDLPNYDQDAAGAAYSTMMTSIQKALLIRGEKLYINIRDVLVETEDKYLYVKVLGNTKYAIVVAMGKDGNLGYLRATLKKVEPELIKALS